MKRIWNIFRFLIFSSVFSFLLASLFHFAYDFFGQGLIFSFFFPTNESVWEHLKLLFYPMLIAAIIEFFFVKEIANNYIEAKTIGIFASICITTITFFTYTGIIGTNFLLIDILIFIFSIILGEWIAYKIMKKEEQSTTLTKILSGIIVGFLLICFIVCTYCPPEVNFFKDYTTGNYGIQK